jgi:hypothetical protein
MLRKARVYLTVTQVSEVCSRYQAGESMAALGKVFGVPASTIQRRLRREGVQIHKGTYYSKHTANYAYFHIIDTEEKAYWLGFIAADGCVSTDQGYFLHIALQCSDEEHLKQFLGALKATHPIQHYPKYPHITIGSKELIQDLGQWGITPRKTYTLTWPQLPGHLIRHYIRGFVDGDGCWSTGPSFSVFGLAMFMQQIQKVLMHECGLKKTAVQSSHVEDTTKPFARLAYRGRLQVCRIADYLYEDATIWLPRKRDKIETLLKE